MNQSVIINLKKDLIVIKIDEQSEYRDIRKNLERKIYELRKLYKQSKTPILVTGKILKNREITEIQNIIQREIEVEVEFDMPKTLGLSGIKKTYDQEIGKSETKYHKGSLRSGQKIEYEGSIVIIGDVNSGSEVIASENIIVLGKIRGLVHAGAKGNKKAVIAGESIEAPQIRISNIIKEMTKNEEDYCVKLTYAYVNDNKIELE